MTFSRAFVLFFLIGLFGKAAFSQDSCAIMYPQAHDENWGKGVLYLPESVKLTLYKSQAGEVAGRINFQEGKFTFTALGVETASAQWEEQTWTDGKGITFIQARPDTHAGYYQVFWKTVSPGFYCSKEDMDVVGVSYFSYQELLAGENLPDRILNFRERANLGVNLPNTCLNLRTTPSFRAKRKAYVYGNDWSESEHTHIKVMGWKDNWAEVQVTLYGLPESADLDINDCGYAIKEQWEGWIVAVDHKGFPTIWFSGSTK